ncbi:MAG: transposase [Gammaproteobacteria bacterium]
MRRGLDEELLADLTLTSQSTISRLLTTWINFLYLRLGSLPTWPSAEQVSQCLPDAFRKSYSDTFVIIDCLELRCEVPSSLPLQSQLYSTYKSHTTFKGLIGIVPSGAVAFISELFTGSISDRELFEQSGLLKLLETVPRGKSLMADRGFDIEDLLAPLGIKLNVPARKPGLQLTEAGVLRTQRIARVRIHVERAINRAKNFTIFDKVIPLSLAGSINQMWSVCCLLTNFQPPLLEA